MFGYHTILQGHRVAVWDKGGRRTLIDGPRRMLTRGQRVEPLAAKVAGPDQYLVVRMKGGDVAHVPGPVSVWFDPVEHAEITVAGAVVLDAHEAVVVYKHRPDRIARRLVRGPARFVPASDEWLHEFRWHGADPNNPNRKIPRGLRFQRLRVIPDQMYCDVEDVRTADDALVVVKLMIFFELASIETMLDQTHDPIADFMNSVTADIIDFSSARTFERFKEQTNLLSEIATYPHLVQRAQRIGYRINKVIYRGFGAAAKLQAMHDGAIETRTRLRLEAETEAQAQELADMKLAREQERAGKRRAMDAADAEHQIRIKRIAHDEELRRQQSESGEKLRAERERQELALRYREARHRQREAYLKSLDDLHVDMTRLLVARHERPDKRIRIDGTARPRVSLGRI